MKKGTKAMSKRAEEAQASAILPESIISYVKEHAVLSGLVYREDVKYGYEQTEKDTIERAYDMLMNYVFEEVTPEMRDHFRKRLKEE